MAKHETRVGILGSPAGQIQRWDDTIVLSTIAAAASVNEFAPPAGCAVQVEAWGFTIVTAITTAAGANAVFGISGVEDGAGYADFHHVDVEGVAGGTLAIGAFWEFNSDGAFCNGVLVSALAANTFAPFFLDANDSDYCNFDVSTAGAGAGAAGTVRPFIRYRFLVAPEQDFNESNFFGYR